MGRLAHLFLALQARLSRSAPPRDGAGQVWHTLNEEVDRLYQAGEYERAVVVAREALEVAKTQAGPDHPDVAASLNNLALLCRAQGQYAQAELFHHRSLAIWESRLGPDHPDVAIGLNNLAALCIVRGQYAQAEPLYQRALTILQILAGIMLGPAVMGRLAP
ncbi:MAG: tetratricopeptide repeat protein, partial [Magnetococcus sp. DMHC-8]